MKKIIIGLCLMGATLTSCNEFLDMTPLIAFQTKAYGQM